MFPLIFKSLCAHNFSIVQHFTRTHMNSEWHVKNNFYEQRTFLKGTSIMRSKFSWMRSSHDLCARTSVQLRGKIEYNTIHNMHVYQSGKKFLSFHVNEGLFAKFGLWQKNNTGPLPIRRIWKIIYISMGLTNVISLILLLMRFCSW